ncbi:hypothetical protein [Nocardioides sp. KR10-350]|uniref:hypothetical protein n=1 Tax=Nocardioides cheoyonin TaxID=3156615 RepID=UPI0032B390EB
MAVLSWRRDADDPDTVTTAEITRLYTADERAAARRAHAAWKAGDEVRKDHLLAEARLGWRDVALICERVRPVWTTEQRDVARAIWSVLGDPSRSGEILDRLEAAGLDADDIALMDRLGMARVWTTPPSVAQTQPVTAARITAPAIGQEEQWYAAHGGGHAGPSATLSSQARPAPKRPAPKRPASPASAEDLPPHIRAITLPDGTDTTDAATQIKWQARIHDRLGPTWWAMWQRFPDVEDGVPPVIHVVNARPNEVVLPFKDGKAPDPGVLARQAEADGLGVLIEFDRDGQRALFADISAETKALRNRLATSPKVAKAPWDLEIVCRHVIDEKTQMRRLDQVIVLRALVTEMETDKRLALFRSLINLLPGGSTGWEVLDDPVTGMVRFRYGQPRTLPKRVSARDLLPTGLIPSDWRNIPLGLDDRGNPVGIDLKLGPHTAVVGPTNTGKSVLMRQHALSALARGHQIIICDASSKKGVDFAKFRPYALTTARTLAELAATLEAVYREGMRRADILERAETTGWQDLPADVRARERIGPITVLWDEIMAAITEEPVPSGLDPKHPAVVEAKQNNGYRALITSYLAKITFQLRWTGIFLVLGFQAFDANLFKGFSGVRNNLTSTVLLTKPGSVPKPERLTMVFPGDQTSVALETISELDDGQSMGLAVTAAEGGTVAGFRVAFCEVDEIPEMLTNLGVRKPEPWVIDVPEPEPVEGTPISGSGPVSFTKPTAPAPSPFPADEPEKPTVTELGELEFSLDDLVETADEEPQPEPGTEPDLVWPNETPAEPEAPAQEDDAFDGFTDDDFAPRPVVAPVVSDDDEFGPSPTPRLPAHDDPFGFGD